MARHQRRRLVEKDVILRKRSSWPISTRSRNPSVVISAVAAPLRSIKALVASVVPRIRHIDVGPGQPRLGEDFVHALNDAALGGGRRVRTFTECCAAGISQDDIGEGSSDVDGDPNPPSESRGGRWIGEGSVRRFGRRVRTSIEAVLFDYYMRKGKLYLLHLILYIE